MYNTTDIQSLGTDYTVADQKGNIIRNIQIIPHTDILEAALGPYTEEEFDSYSAYLEKSIEVLSGFDDIDPNKILWFATEEEEVQLVDVVEYAIKHGYDKVILEYLDDLDMFDE